MERLLLYVLLCCVTYQCSCRPHRGQLERKLQLEAIKKGILESLGMKNPPVLREDAWERKTKEMQLLYEELLRLYRNSSQAEGPEPQPENLSQKPPTVLYSAHVESVKMAEFCLHGDRFRAVFNKTHLIRKELMAAHAQMKISGKFWDCSHGRKPQLRQEVQIKIHHASNRTQKHPEEEALILTKVLYNKSLRVSIGVPAEDWGLNSEEPLVLEVQIVTAENWCLRETPQMLLEMETSTPEVKRQRQRRQAAKEDECKEDKCCCRKSLLVSFKDIGWSDWVVAPETYTMYFCDGSCPHNYKPASMHAQIKYRVFHLTKGATPRPSCVPAAYEPMLLMHYNSNGKLTYTLFDELIVSKCHCA
ncbi:interleukin-6 receptor subunit beta-like [Arapaima gigas]